MSYDDVCEVEDVDCDMIEIGVTRSVSKIFGLFEERLIDSTPIFYKKPRGQFVVVMRYMSCEEYCGKLVIRACDSSTFQHVKTIEQALATQFQGDWRSSISHGIMSASFHPDCREYGKKGNDFIADLAIHLTDVRSVNGRVYPMWRVREVMVR